MNSLSPSGGGKQNYFVNNFFFLEFYFDAILTVESCKIVKFVLMNGMEVNLKLDKNGNWFQLDSLYNWILYCIVCVWQMDSNGFYIVFVFFCYHYRKEFGAEFYFQFEEIVNVGEQVKIGWFLLNNSIRIK